LIGGVSDTPRLPGAPPASPRRQPWKQRCIDWVVHQLTQGITPEKLALTLAVGTACGLFPIVGTTTLLCFVAGIVLRLNQPAIQLVNGVCTPVHLPVILLLHHLGSHLFGVPHPTYGMRFFSNMFWVFWDTPGTFFHQFGVLAWHLVVAWSIAAPVWSLLVYCTTLPVLREIQRMRLAGAFKNPH
jgi:uncharacterized protein (DUF2062 family)